ncbi:MAG: tRNA lysidine(34) synthetase TilS [Candidatus Eisenbacteria bacterium]
MSVVRDKVRATIRRYGMISVRDTVLAAVSGGPDSVCLLHVLAGLRDELEFELRVAHLDHRFRGEESRRDAEFVSDLAGRLGLPCRCEEENVPAFLLSNSMSKQDAARMLRYKFLVTVSKQEYCQRIATGHNADDQAETVLMRVIRGSGPDGLAGIPPKRDGTIIRPLIDVWRSEIESYLEEHDLPHRTDESNLESAYARNRVRNELLPVLAEYNPRISQSLVTLGRIMTGVREHFDRLTDEALPRVVKSTRLGQFALDSTVLSGYDEALQRSVFRRVLETLRPDLPPPSFRHVESIAELLRRNEVGVAAELPDGAKARLEHGCLTLSTGEGPPGLPELELPAPGVACFEDAGLSITAELVDRQELRGAPEETMDDDAVFDWDRLSPPLRIRGRRQGDRFCPFGMEGTKTVKQFLIDSKVAASLRDAVPLVLDLEGILWLAGMRRSARAPVGEDTKTVLVLKARRSD